MSEEKIIKLEDKQMEEIKNQYQICIEHLEDMIELYADISSRLQQNYEGQCSMEIIPTIDDKLKKHLELLQLCYTNTKEYVDNVMKTITEADQELSRWDIFVTPKKYA